MKTIDERSRFPKPFRFALYLLVVSVMGFMNWIVTYANDPGINSKPSLESRLAEALKVVPDPEPELSEWILSFSGPVDQESKEDIIRLEERLAEAEKPIDDPQPALEDWLLNFSEDFLSRSGE